MAADLETLTCSGIQIVPDVLHRDSLSEHLRSTIASILAGGPHAAISLPALTSAAYPVLQDSDGQENLIVEPPRDYLAIQDQLRDDDKALHKLVSTLREERSSDEWSQAYFKKLQDHVNRRRSLLDQAKPEARPAAVPFTPPYPAVLDSAMSERGGYLNLESLPPMLQGNGLAWVQSFVATLPRHMELDAKYAKWHQLSADVAARADLTKRSESDEWRQAYFKGVRDATNDRNPVYQSGQVTPLGENYFCKDRNWSQDEYHETFFATERQRVEQQNHEYEAIKETIPADLFAPSLPASDDGTAEFMAMSHVFGELRERVLVEMKSQDACEFQSQMHKLLRDKLQTLDNREAVIVPMLRAIELQEEMS